MTDGIEIVAIQRRGSGYLVDVGFKIAGGVMTLQFRLHKRASGWFPSPPQVLRGRGIAIDAAMARYIAAAAANATANFERADGGDRDAA